MCTVHGAQEEIQGTLYCIPELTGLPTMTPDYDVYILGDTLLRPYYTEFDMGHDVSDGGRSCVERGALGSPICVTVCCWLFAGGQVVGFGRVTPAPAVHDPVHLLPWFLRGVYLQIFIVLVCLAAGGLVLAVVFGLRACRRSKQQQQLATQDGNAGRVLRQSK